MKIVVYYFTRTGRSENVAKFIADKKDVEIFEIKDNINWNGFLGYIKASFQALIKKSVHATYRNPKSDEQVLLVMPLWAGTFPPSVRRFINGISREKITLIVTSTGSKLKDRHGFLKVIDLVGKDATIDEVEL